MSKPFQVTLAPELVFQPMNPMSFFQPVASYGAIDVNVGYTPRRDVETEILEKVGSYGRQISRLGDALEVLTRYLPREILDEKSRNAIDALLEQLTEIRDIKRRMGADATNAGPKDA